MSRMIFARGDDDAVEGQIKACQAWSEENDGRRVPNDRIFVDRLVPSGNKKRGLLKGLIAMLRGISVDTVVCTDYSRLTCDKKMLEELLTTCRKRGIRLVEAGRCPDLKHLSYGGECRPVLPSDDSVISKDRKDSL